MKKIDQAVYKKDRINAVVARGLCTECGACYGICPKDNIQIGRTIHGNYIFNIANPGKCGKCNLCIQVCPGAFVDFNSLYQAIFEDDEPDSAFDLVGVYKDVFLGRAINSQVFEGGATAGVTTALMIYAIEKGIIGGVFVTQMDKSANGNPLDPQLFFAQTSQDIIDGQQSKYTSVPMGICLKEILHAHSGKNFGFVGLGCHIQALRKAEQVLPALKKRILFRIGLFCGHSMDQRGTRHLLRLVGAPENIVARIDYRYGSWPGYFNATLTNGRTGSIGHIDWTSYVLTLYERRRCHFCTDPLNQLADISVGDPWVQELADSSGKNIIIPRTKIGINLVQSAVREGALQTESWGADNVIRSQKKTLYRKRHMIRAYMKFADILGQAIPVYQGQLTDHPLTFKEYRQAIALELIRMAALHPFMQIIMSKLGILFLTLKKVKLKKTGRWY